MANEDCQAGMVPKRPKSIGDRPESRCTKGPMNKNAQPAPMPLPAM